MSKVTPAQLIYGLVRNRQGGTTGANSWRTSGTSNTDVSAKGVFIQVGTIGTSTGGDTTVTFPTAYTQVPIVLATVTGNNAGTGGVTQNAFAIVNTISTTTFTMRTINTSASASDQSVSWIAIGE